MARQRGKNKESVARISEILPRLFKKLGLSGRNRKIRDTWREIIGEEWSSLTRVSGFRSGVLTVEVKDSTLLQELTVYYKRDLLKLLQKKLTVRVSDLRFKLASERLETFLEDRENPPLSYKELGF